MKYETFFPPFDKEEPDDEEEDNVPMAKRRAEKHKVTN
jgi:hypothetical protein